MSRIDYSKWDKLDVSDSDDESNYTPRVTQLSQPSSITHSPDGVTVHPTQENSVKMSSELQTKMKDKKVLSTTRNGGKLNDPISNIDKAYWRQDRNEVSVRIVYDHTSVESRHIRLKSTGLLKYDDRHSAVGGGNKNHGKIIITAIGHETPLFEGELAYATHLAKDEVEVDWEIEIIDSSKVVLFTLFKAVPMQDLTIWWSRPFLQFPEIDVVEDIEDRKRGVSETSKGSLQPDQWKENWDQAHRMFREKIISRGDDKVDINSF